MATNYTEEGVSSSGPVPVAVHPRPRVKDAALAREPKPEWLKVRAPGSPRTTCGCKG